MTALLRAPECENTVSAPPSPASVELDPVRGTFTAAAGQSFDVPVVVINRGPSMLAFSGIVSPAEWGSLVATDSHGEPHALTARVAAESRGRPSWVASFTLDPGASARTTLRFTATSESVQGECRQVASGRFATTVGAGAPVPLPKGRYELRQLRALFVGGSHLSASESDRATLIVE